MWFLCFQSLEEKEELELRCTQLKGDARIYRQRNKQTLRQLEEVIKERDKVRMRRERDEGGQGGGARGGRKERK